MARKKKHDGPVLQEYLLPSADIALRKFITDKKVDMMQQAIASIEYAINNNLSVVEIFQFTGSDFVVMLSDKDFLPNLEHIYDYYLINEMYEFCERVLGLKKRLDITIKLNETKTH